VVVVARGGEPVLVESDGFRDMAAGTEMDLHTVFRIYSMTKPITAVAALMLMEEGRLGLNDPVAQHIEAFAHQKVYRAGSSQSPELDPVTEPMRVWHLLTHMSGLTYGFANAHPVDAMYRAAGFDFGLPRDTDLETCADRWASLPLMFQPGSGWAYGVSTDVLGRVIEVVSGQTLPDFFQEKIFDPLGMSETRFWAEGSLADRLVPVHVPNPADDRRAVRYDPLGAAALQRPSAASGGGGLVSTAADYQRFVEMLRRRGIAGNPASPGASPGSPGTATGATRTGAARTGAARTGAAGTGAAVGSVATASGDGDAIRLLSPRSVDLMSANHLPGGGDLRQFNQSMFSETTLDGVGFGLGVSTLIDPVAAKSLASVGEFGWGGAASTVFWVDPATDITVVFLTSLIPSSSWPIRTDLRQLVYQALID